MRRRDDPVFEEFVRARSPALLRTAHLLVGDVGAAEDLLQATFERLARSWRQIDGDPEGYVRRTMANLAIDGWRRRSRRPLERLGDVPEAPVEADTSVDDRGDLAAALATLTARQRTVLVLRYLDDLSEAQVAAALGVAPGTVKSTASRALAQLREHQSLRSNG